MLYTNNDIYCQFKPKNNNLSFRQKSDSLADKHNESKINIPALTGSVIGTLIPMFLLKQKQKTTLFKIGYEFKEMIFVGTGAILGGLTGGIVKDKKEKVWDKVKEANFQWISNLFLPTLFVDQFLKYADKKFLKNKTAKFAAVVTGIGAGMKIGEFITNKIHSCVEKEPKQKRKIEIKDTLLHFDDIPVALTLSKVFYMDKLLPFCFIYSGYQAGKKE